MSENKCLFCAEVARTGKDLCFNCIPYARKYIDEGINEIKEYLRDEIEELKKEDTIESHFKCASLMYALKIIGFDKTIKEFERERF